MIALTVLPVAASYIAYYVLPPSGRTNYGTLIEPQRPVPALPLENLDGTAFDLRQLRGRWVFVMVDSGNCDARCAGKLLMMRQQRTMTGKERDQIERVWLVADQQPLPILLMREYEGTLIARAPLDSLRKFLPLPDAADARLQDHIWVIDPRGNLMLRWPKEPEISGVKRDIAKLLKVAAGWIKVEPATKAGAP
ncbi:MAG: cytochrome C oxidase subunit I [Burkholderiaceae bacterium]|nr:cytochrome C oxidase subunit I [Burkholderiaceae bacterium]